ncbi:MAG: M14 family zinc carboxypeptidase [Candidatus Cloacimonadota bacterium]|nr:M14 family zinc carboxypeptidase [Candidatus Cloacimonadota bacterium]
MKKLLFTLLFCIILISSVFAWRDNEKEVRVFYNNDFELGKLIDLQPRGDIYPNGEALIYVIPSEFEALKSTGLKYRIEREDVKAFAENFWTSMDNTREAYHTYAEIVALADSLVTAFPSICEKHLFGTSVQGRELGALKISDNVSLDENEAEVMFDGGIHGDEVGAAENCIRFARDLCRDYGTDPYITELIDSREIWIYYMVNPDGRVADNRYNANGVDLNRDSGYMWDGWGNSTGAFSQIESKALRDCHYNRQFVVHTTYHSGTEYISCPWSYRADQCPDFDHILQLAGEYSSSSGYANMEYGQGCTGMYPINGSTKDTNYGMMGAISWSMEISYNKHPSTSQIQYYYQINVPAMLSMIEYSGYGLEGVVTDANTGDAITAAVFIDDYFPCYTDPAVGDYHKYVLPGTYDITIVANGYETQTITNVTVTANNSSVTNFQLTPQDGQFAYKICSSRIPDNNTADEGDTPGVIGAPDSRNYSIGKDGWVVVDMQYPIPDGPGNDIMIYEGDTSAEGYTCFASENIDGPWHSLGTGNGTTEFDLANGNLIDAQFVKIVDDGDGVQTAPNAGFDLDAVEALEQVQGVYIAFLGYEIDEMIGNNNGFIDPGETIDMLVTIRNNGSQLAEDVDGLLSTTSPYITMNNGDIYFGDLAAGQEVSGIFTFTVDISTPIGELLLFDLAIEANAGAYNTNFGISCVVGIMIEDFENNNFESFEWQFGGNANWITTTGAYEGNYCARSGSIGHNQTSSLYLEVNVLSAGDLSFYKKVSSEYNYDFLRFYIDNTQMGSWSGTSDWTEEIYPVTAGNHTFKWEYTKDQAVVGGSDCGWIDYIVFPPISIEPTLDPPTNLTAEIIDYNSSIIISWDAAIRSKQINRDLLGYNVYFDEVFVEYVTNSPYEFTGPFAPGDYYLEVTAVYDEGESEAAEITVTITLNPPENLVAESTGDDIILTWDLPTSVRGIVEYKIYCDGTEIATTTETTYTDQAMQSGSYTYGVTVLYDGGYESDPAEVIIDHTDAGLNLIPIVTELTKIFPNPFNPETTIDFSLHLEANVNISVFNIKGQKVLTLVNEQLDAGYHQVAWKGGDEQEKQVSSGIYFIKMDTNQEGIDYISMKKIILLK